MNTRLALALLCCLTLSKPLSALGQTEIHTQIYSESYSEPISVYAWGNNWSGRLQSGERAYSRSRASLIAQTAKGTRYGVISRYDYNLHFNEKTARFYYDNERGLVDTLENTPIYLNAQHLSASGFLIGFQKTLKPGLALTIDLIRLRAHDLIEGSISGQLSIQNDQSLLDGQLDYAYQEDQLLDRPNTPATLGWGWALDIAIDWKLTDQWDAQLTVSDAMSEIKWSSVPFTQGTFNTSDQIEAGRRITFDPLLSGIEGQRDETQRLPIHTKAYLNYRLTEHHRLNIKLKDNPIQTQFGFAGSVDVFRKKYRLGGEAMLPIKAVGLFAQSDWLKIRLASDSVSIRRANWFQLDFGFSLRF